MAKSCASKSQELLNEISLPKVLFLLDDIIEVGYNCTVKFVWLKQKCKKEHRFRFIGRNVSYDNEVMAFVKERCMRNLTGVKTKELFIWVSISDIYIDDRSSGKITFANPTAISRSFLVLVFELDNERNSGK